MSGSRLGLVAVLLVASIACSAETDSGRGFGELDVATSDYLHARLREGDPRIDWVGVGQRFVATTAVSVRPDDTMYLVDDDKLYMSDGRVDTWTEVSGVDAGRGCIQDTPEAALLPDDNDKGFFVEISPGRFDLVELPGPEAVGCSFVVRNGRVWGTRGGTAVFVVDLDGANYHEIALTGPTDPVGRLEVFSSAIAPSEPGFVHIYGVDPTGLSGAGESWAWLVAADERPTSSTGLPGPNAVRPVGGFDTVAGAHEVLTLLGEPGDTYRTVWSGPSKAVHQLSGDAQWINSVWIAPRHFIGVGEEILGFGVFTVDDGTEIEPAIWRLSPAGWTERRGAGPGPGSAADLQVVHRVAGEGDRVLAVTCDLDAIDCGVSESSSVWLGTLRTTSAE